MCFRVDPSTGQDSGKGIRFISPAFVDWWLARLAETRPAETVHPLGQVPFIFQAATLRFELGVFGLLPDKPWVSTLDKGRCCYNARSETVNTKPSFREAILNNRSVIPVRAFWEWSEKTEEQDGKAHLYHISAANSETLWLGSIYAFHPKFSYSTAIVTTEPIEQVLKEAHHIRSPLILEESQIEQWLDPNKKDWHQIQPVLKPNNGQQLKIERIK